MTTDPLRAPGTDDDPPTQTVADHAVAQYVAVVCLLAAAGIALLALLHQEGWL